MGFEKAKEKLGEETKKLFAWRHCEKCGANYPYFQTVCYKCWRASKERPENPLQSEAAKNLITVTGDALPPLIRLNSDYPMPKDYKGLCNCFECTEHSFCAKFGKAELTCQREDWEYCPCKKCCIAAKEFVRKK